MELPISLSDLHVTPEAADFYDLIRGKMAEEVNQIMLIKSNLHDLIGNKSNQPAMIDNHHNHSLFMSAVLNTNNFGLLERTLPWVYRTYANHGFSFDYFPVELNAWIQVIDHTFEPSHAKSIIPVYKWIRQRHQRTIEETRHADAPLEDAFPPPRHPVFDDFMSLLLAGKHRECQALCNQLLEQNLPLPLLFVSLLQPAMYRVGTLWERNDISIAKEHLYSCIVTKIVTSISTDLPTGNTDLGKVIVTSAPGEYHEIGAWMVAIALEQAGFNVLYLGANTPGSELVDLIVDEKPKLLAISAALSNHVKFIHEIIETIDKDNRIASLPIIVGGLAFRRNPELAKALAHRAVFANDCSEALTTALMLIQTENRPEGPEHEEPN